MHSSPWGKKQNWHNFDQQCVYDPAEVCVTEVVQSGNKTQKCSAVK